MKLSQGWEYPQLRRWLFEEVATEDVPALGLKKGEKFGEVWLRSARSPANAGHFCELALGTWYRSRHGEWERQRLLRSEPMRAVRRAAVLTRAASNRVTRSQGLEEREESGRDSGDLRSMERRGQETGAERPEGEEAISVEGGDVLMRSVLIDAISTMKDEDRDRREISQLASAWAKLNETTMAAEKLRLKTDEALTTGLRAVKDELKALPEAMELFEKMVEVIHRSKKPVDPLAEKK